MKVTRRIGKIIKPLVNFPRWMGVNQLRINAQFITTIWQDLKLHRPPVRRETFAEAKTRLNLTEDDIQKRLNNCLLLSVIYGLCTLILLGYTLYLIIHFQLGVILSFLLTSLMAALAYREHFWYFQLKTRTLGNSFSNWLSFLLRGGIRKL
jgi:intracellular multiplication protein IcmV